ncbi:hypothetical protein SORBI_3007G203800 [Sorghum bicolor]|uniref:Uncharacterized protein n=1 Tax=Sorghum bicolor TaxID=4558 RepID=C5YIB0_SORBI|nr:hypothetical protein SORBI_3007G203800 [Sorghum bicolor]
MKACFLISASGKVPASIGPPPPTHVCTRHPTLPEAPPPVLPTSCPPPPPPPPARRDPLALRLVAPRRPLSVAFLNIDGRRLQRLRSKF